MKNLLFINGHMNPGGAEKSLLDILNHMDYSKYHVELLLMEELGGYADEIPKEVEVRLFDLHNTYGSVLSSAKRCIKQRDWKNLWVRFVFACTQLWGIDKLKWAAKTIVGNKEYDCVIAFRPGVATRIAAYAVRSKRKITWWHHGKINLNDSQQREYESSCREMDRIVAVSKGCADILADCFPTLRDKITVIPNMIDAEQLRVKAGAYVPFEKQNGVFDLVSVGRLSPEKHIENVIVTAEALAKQGKRFRWFIVGDGVQRTDLEEQICEKALSDCVFFVGSKKNPYPYMKWADLFVHTSYVESQGIVILESMALRIPCVVTKSLGPCEFIQDNVNGILTEQNPESLTAQVLRMMQDKELYERIKENENCPEQFAPEAVIGLIYRAIEGKKK